MNKSGENGFKLNEQYFLQCPGFMFSTAYTLDKNPNESLIKKSTVIRDRSFLKGLKGTTVPIHKGRQYQ